MKPNPRSGYIYDCANCADEVEKTGGVITTCMDHQALVLVAQGKLKFSEGAERDKGE